MTPRSLPQFGRWLKEQRRGRMTQTELAAASGITKIHICRIETGKSGVTPETVQKLADAMGLDEGEAMLWAGFIRHAPHLDNELQKLFDGLSIEQRRIVFDVAVATRDALLGPRPFPIPDATSGPLRTRPLRKSRTQDATPV